MATKRANYSYVTNTLTNKSNNHKYNQKIGMTKTKNAPFFEIAAGQFNDKKIAHIEKKGNNLILKFDQDFFNCVKFNDDNFSDSDLGKLIKEPLKLNASVSGSPSIILKEQTSNELILSVICDNEEQLSITFNALGVSINQNGNIHKGLLDKNEFPELSKENCTNTFNMSTNFFEEILKGNVDYRTDKIKGKNDAKLTDFPPFLWGLYFDLIELKKDKADFYQETISDKNLISYELDGAKYAFVKNNNDVFFYSKPNNNKPSSLKQINVNTNKNNRHEVWLYEDSSKNKFLVVGYSGNQYLKLPIPKDNDKAKEFLNNFNNKICNIRKDIRAKNKYFDYPVSKQDPRKLFEYKFGVRGTSDEFDFDEDTTENLAPENPAPENPAPEKSDEDKKEDNDKKEDDDKKEDTLEEEPKEYKLKTSFYGDMFATLSFFALIAMAFFPGLGVLFAGISVACMAGSITMYAADGYKLSVQPSIKKIKDNDYTKFKTNDKALQKDLENLKVSQKVMQDFIENADNNSFTKNFVDLYNKNGIQKEHLDFAQNYSLVAGTTPDLKTLIQLENFRNETNPEEKDKIKEEILNNFEAAERTDKEQQLFGQSPLFDIEQLNVQQDINQDLDFILNEEDKDEKIKLQNSFIEKYFPSLEENLETTRSGLFDNKKDIKEFNFNLEHLINSEKLIINDKERNIKLIEENNIDYLINLFSNRDEKECTKMLADYGEVVARRFAYGKNLSQVQLTKFINVLPENLQEDAIKYISQKFDNIDKAINLLHEKIEKNVSNEKSFNETYNFIEILLNSKNQQSDKVLNTLSEELRNKITNLKNSNNMSLTNALIEIANNEDNNIHKRICSILSIKNFEITNTNDLSIKIKNQNGSEKTFTLDIENFKTLIENKKKENNENSTRECLVLSKVLGEDFIKNEIITLKSQGKDNENETTSGEISENDKKYQDQENTNKNFTETYSELNKNLSKLDQNLNSSTINKTELNSNIGIMIDNLRNISSLNKKIKSKIKKLEEFRNNNDVNKSKIRKTIKEIRDLLSSIEKKNNKSLTKTNKELVSSQNLQKLPTGKQVSKNIKTFNLDGFQDYINQNLNVNVNENKESNGNDHEVEDESEMS